MSVSCGAQPSLSTRYALGVQTNVLYYGDNLDILRRYIPDETVDLIYLDPPFNSNADYNVIFKDESGSRTDAQLLAFEDTWHWGPDALPGCAATLARSQDRVIGQGRTDTFPLA